MAGQEEYLPSHTFSFGHPHSVYLLVVDLSVSEEERDDRAKHWLSSISSCHDFQKQGRPPVILVASHADLDPVQCGLSQNGLKTNGSATRLLHKLEADFGEQFNFIGDAIVMDCRETRSKEIKHLKKVLVTILEEVLPTVPDQPGACELIRSFLPRMTRLTRGQILDWPNFLRLVSQQIYDDNLMTTLPPQQERILKEVIGSLQESGEIIQFETGEKVYVVLDMEWMFSLVNGRIFCPLHMTGTRPRLNYDDNGRTSVENFRRVFQDTGEEDLLLELFQNLKIFIRFGEQHIIIPSLMKTNPPADCWVPDESSALVYFGLCMKCCECVGFSPSFFPRLQIRLYNMWLLNYGVEIQMWQGGFKLMQIFPGTKRAVEGVVVLAEDSFDTHIIVRSHRDDACAALALREVVAQQIYEVAGAVSPGSQIDRQVLANASIRQFSVEDRASLVHFNIRELREACEEQRPPRPVDRASIQATTVEEAHLNLLSIESLHNMRITGQLPAFLLDQQTMNVIQEAVGDSWQDLAMEFRVSPQIIADVKHQSRHSPQDACMLLLKHWQKRLTAGFPELIVVLKKCAVDYRAVKAVEACRKRQRQYQDAILTGTLPQRHHHNDILNES